MAIMIDERRVMEENAIKYRDRVNSPIRKFSDKPFTPTRYWHIKTDKTTLDQGWKDVSVVLGKNSPIKYNMIDGLPLLGIEGIMPQINTGDNGLDSSHEGDASTINGTIRPLENDYFMITYLKQPFIFRVTSVEYDNIASESTYKISYVLEYNGWEWVDALMKQTLKKFVCIMANIGTDEQCIIETGVMDNLKKIEEMYDSISDTYKTFFYNARYNCFLGDFMGGTKLYDPLQTVFIRKHGLFAKKNQIDGLVITDQFQDPRRDIKYHKSIYHCVESRQQRLFSNFEYQVTPGMSNPQTAFSKWLDSQVLMLDITANGFMGMTYHIFEDEYVDAVKFNAPTGTRYSELLRRFINREEISLSDISLDLHDDLVTLDDANLEVFFMTPIIMYILRQVIKDNLAKEKMSTEVNHFFE